MYAIPSLANQIEAAAHHAACLALEQAKPPARRSTPPRPTGKYGAKGLRVALLERLPVGRENAIPQGAVRKLLPDIDYATTGLGATLAELAENGAIRRAGSRGHYLYHRP